LENIIIDTSRIGFEYLPCLRRKNSTRPLVLHCEGSETREGVLNNFDVLLGADPKSPDFGKVFVWEERKSPWMEGTNTRGLGLAGETFTDFINGLSARHEL
jgi:hypothetical protein